MNLNESRGTTGDLTCTIWHTICIHIYRFMYNTNIYIYIYIIYIYLFKNDQH